MPDSYNESKQRWNNSHYTQIKVSVITAIATAFKATCAANGVSMAGILSAFMADYSHSDAGDRAKSDNIATRRQRRSTVKNVISQMEKLLLAEERFRDNIPENLQGSKWYEAAEQSISVMQESIDLLSDIY